MLTNANIERVKKNVNENNGDIKNSVDFIYKMLNRGCLLIPSINNNKNTIQEFLNLNGFRPLNKLSEDDYILKVNHVFETHSINSFGFFHRNQESANFRIMTDYSVVVIDVDTNKNRDELLSFIEYLEQVDEHFYVEYNNENAHFYYYLNETDRLKLRNLRVDGVDVIDNTYCRVYHTVEDIINVKEACSTSINHSSHREEERLGFVDQLLEDYPSDEKKFRISNNDNVKLDEKHNPYKDVKNRLNPIPYGYLVYPNWDKLIDLIDHDDVGMNHDLALNISSLVLYYGFKVIDEWWQHVKKCNVRENVKPMNTYNNIINMLSSVKREAFLDAILRQKDPNIEEEIKLENIREANNIKLVESLKERNCEWDKGVNIERYNKWKKDKVTSKAYGALKDLNFIIKFLREKNFVSDNNSFYLEYEEGVFKLLDTQTMCEFLHNSLNGFPITLEDEEMVKLVRRLHKSFELFPVIEINYNVALLDNSNVMFKFKDGDGTFICANINICDFTIDEIMEELDLLLTYSFNCKTYDEKLNIIMRLIYIMRDIIVKGKDLRPINIFNGVYHTGKSTLLTELFIKTFNSTPIEIDTLDQRFKDIKTAPDLVYDGDYVFKGKEGAQRFFNKIKRYTGEDYSVEVKNQQFHNIVSHKNIPSMIVCCNGLDENLITGPLKRRCNLLHFYNIIPEDIKLREEEVITQRARDLLVSMTLDYIKNPNKYPKVDTSLDEVMVKFSGFFEDKKVKETFKIGKFLESILIEDENSMVRTEDLYALVNVLCENIGVKSKHWKFTKILNQHIDMRIKIRKLGPRNNRYRAFNGYKILDSFMDIDNLNNLNYHDFIKYFLGESKFLEVDVYE